MRLLLAALSLATMSACSTPKPISADEFSPHLRFRPDSCPAQLVGSEMLRCLAETRERALAACRHEADVESNRVLAARGGSVAAAIDSAHLRMLTLKSCMDAKGYGWREPR